MHKGPTDSEDTGTHSLTEVNRSFGFEVVTIL